MIEYCAKPLTRNRSKYDPIDLHRCFCQKGHQGRCEEFPYLRHLASAADRVAKKVMRDSTKTTGAAWKSEDAGPNRISRWVMLLPDNDLMRLGVNIGSLKPVVVSKLRDKAATYEDCMSVAAKLTWLAYGMTDAPIPPADTQAYLEELFGQIIAKSTTCLICRAPLDFRHFALARRGKAEIETAHAAPRSHNPANVGFAHRLCNIAQGDRSLNEFYAWIKGILDRVSQH